MRDGRLYARGASDDKGNFLPLLHVACELARAGELPVHVRVVLEGEEEIGGTNVLRFLDEDERGADCAIVFDGGDGRRGAPRDAHRRARHRGRPPARAHGRARPPLGRLRRRGAERRRTCSRRCSRTVLPGPDGRLRDELRAGLQQPSPEEIASWAELPAGADVLAEAGAARDRSRAPPRELYARTWADASLDVHGIEGGDARAAPHDHPGHGAARA